MISPVFHHGCKMADDALILSRRAKVANLALKRLSLADIQSVLAAEGVHVHVSTISRDISDLRRQWAEEAAADTGTHRARELAELHAMEREVALQWSNDKDAKWLRLRLDIKTRRARMMGLDMEPIQAAPPPPPGERARRRLEEMSDDELLDMLEAQGGPVIDVTPEPD